MLTCPACGGALVRLPSSRLNQVIGSLTGRRPFTCAECLWVGRLMPPRDARRARHAGSDGEPVPHRRRGEALSACPVCGQDTIVPATMRRIDRVIAAVTRRIPLVCEYCRWSGRRRAHGKVRESVTA